MMRGGGEDKPNPGIHSCSIKGEGCFKAQYIFYLIWNLFQGVEPLESANGSKNVAPEHNFLERENSADKSAGSAPLLNWKSRLF